MHTPFIEPKAEATAPSDAEQVRQKLAATEHEITRATEELGRLALHAVLADDQSATEASAKLAGLRLHRELLQRALAAAEQAERDAAAKLSQREFEAKRRALAQHASRFGRQADEVTAALTRLRDAYRALVETGQTITALLPASMRTDALPYHEMLGPATLKDLAEVEAWRLSLGGGLLAPGVTVQPARLRQYEDFQTGEVSPLAEIITDTLAQVRHHFDLTGPNRRQPAPHSTITVSSEPAAPEVLAPLTSPAVGGGGSPAEFRDPVIDLRGQDLGIAKQPAAEQAATADQEEEPTDKEATAA